MSDLIHILEKKKIALAAAKAEVSKLEAQIAQITDVLSLTFEETAFEKLQKTANPFNAATSTSVRNPFQSASDSQLSTLFKPETVKVRNPKGALRAAVLSALSTTHIATLDQIATAVTAKVPKPVTRASLRTEMMKLKREGSVLSEAAGEFRLASKSEVPSGVRTAGAS